MTTTSASSREPLLRVEGLHASYGAIRALRGIDLAVGEGEVVALLGANGAGKSTTMRSIAGVGPRLTGSIRFAGSEVLRQSPEQRARGGIALVPEGRQLFGSMTVDENLRVGQVAARRRGGLNARITALQELFPVLRERAGHAAGSLSGGQQQQVAIARALMSEPRLLLLDEPSLGLSPQVAEVVFTTIRTLRERGTTMLLVEQDVTEALQIADRAYVLASGEVTASGTADEIRTGDDLLGSYFGTEA